MNDPGVSGQGHHFIQRQGRLAGARTGLEGSVQKSQQVNDRRQDPDKSCQRKGHPFGNDFIEPHADRLRQDLRVLKHKEGEERREQGDCFAPENQGELRPGDRGADGVSRSIQSENYRDRPVQIILQAAHGGADSRLLPLESGKLPRRETQKRRLHQGAEERHPKRQGNSCDKHGNAAMRARSTAVHYHLSKVRDCSSNEYALPARSTTTPIKRILAQRTL